MINRLTFANVVGILLENKKKTYTQYQMVLNIFSQYMNDTATSTDLIGDGMIQISRWCNGDRPIPKDLLENMKKKLLGRYGRRFPHQNHSESHQ